MSARHVLRWVGAQSFVAAPMAGAPTVLRFDSDDFMDRLLAMLADAPQTLPSFVATHESWLALAEPTVTWEGFTFPAVVFNGGDSRRPSRASQESCRTSTPTICRGTPERPCTTTQETRIPGANGLWRHGALLWEQGFAQAPFVPRCGRSTEA